jgi:Cu/Ag efflux protein CusF
MPRLLPALALPLLAATLALAQPLTDGEVRKIDKAQGRITLKHGEIKNLDMPPMTMTFRVKDAKALDTLAVGDKVRFAVDKVDGQYTVTTISRAP